MGTGTCWRCGASEDGALSSYGDPRDAEIARLKAEVERLNQQPLPSNLGGYQAFRDMVCAALDIEPTWSNEPALAIARLRAEVAVRDGSWCEQNRKEGRGGCGMCAWCCKDAREQRDALVLDLAAHKRALAAGPAALRAKYAGYKGGIVKGAYDQSADLVERAQADAMKEEP